MVGVARIELATPAMSTRAAPANKLIFCSLSMRFDRIWPIKWWFHNRAGSLCTNRTL